MIDLAFEFWDKDCIEVVSEKMMPGVQFPIASEKPYEFYALLETQGSRREHDEAVRLEDIGMNYSRIHID